MAGGANGPLDSVGVDTTYAKPIYSGGDYLSQGGSKISTSASLRKDLPVEPSTQCRQCGLPSADLFELSRLVHAYDELLETPVVAFIRLCDECLDALTSPAGLAQTS